MGDYHFNNLNRTDTTLNSRLTPKQQDYLKFGQTTSAIRDNHFVKMIGELVQVVTVNTYSFDYYYIGKSENLFNQFFSKLNIQNHFLHRKFLD